MSVTHRKGGGASAEIEKDVREVKAAGEKTAALLALSFKAQIAQDRAAGTNVISDAAILQSAEVIEYDEYADNHAYNTVGEIIKHNGRYYEIKAAHTSNAAAYP
jgi:UDP-glucose 6-dehydrogenase